MARPASNNSIAASLVPTKGSRPTPPERLGAVARQVWQEIVDAKPLGFFEVEHLHALASYCQLEEHARTLEQEMLAMGQIENMLLAEDSKPEVDGRLLAANLKLSEVEGRLLKIRTTQIATAKTLRLVKPPTYMSKDKSEQEHTVSRAWLRGAA